MSKPDITVELETETLAVGEEVKGRVVARADDASAAATSVPVQLLWRTSGECEVEEKIIAHQDVPLDETGSAGFRLEIPAAGPMTYDGLTFSIDWFVRIPGERPVETTLIVVAALKKPEAD